MFSSYIPGRKFVPEQNYNNSLASIAVEIPAVRGVPITCHIASWYWAAKTAQALGLSNDKTLLQTVQNIAVMVEPAQVAILSLIRSGNWDFNITPVTPPIGNVLLWTNGGTHSAIVTQPGVISGYNQVAQFPCLVGRFGYTQVSPQQLGIMHKRCVVISAATIVNKAAMLDL
jgi:hypothetical protein